jgi:hypothetical protein
MKQTVELPWSVGDIGWAIYTSSVKRSKHCAECGHTSTDATRIEEIRECKIDSIDYSLSKDGSRFYYRVAFDLGESEKYDGKYGRFTYGMNVSEVFAFCEEAYASLKNKSV